MVVAIDLSEPFSSSLLVLGAGVPVFSVDSQPSNQFLTSSEKSNGKRRGGKGKKKKKVGYLENE